MKKVFAWKPEFSQRFFEIQLIFSFSERSSLVGNEFSGNSNQQKHFEGCKEEFPSKNFLKTFSKNKKSIFFCILLFPHKNSNVLSFSSFLLYSL